MTGSTVTAEAGGGNVSVGLDAEAIATSLDGKRRGAGWRARCPAHDDHSPSLDIDTGDDGRPLVICRAGCTQDAVIAALRLRGTWNERQAHHADTVDNQARAWAQANAPQGATLVAMHTYQRADGSTDFHVARYRDNGGKQIRPVMKGANGYTFKRPPHEQTPLYRLPDIYGSKGEVVVTEGESCADVLASIGLTATTSGGAQSARRADWSPLKGRDVVVWPDHDQPGAKYGDEVVKAVLAAGARRVRVINVEHLQLEASGDAVDWLKAHCAAGPADVLALEMREIADKREPRILVTAGDILDNPRAVNWLIEGYKERETFGLFVGPFGVGKTAINISEAVHIACGMPIHGSAVAGGWVVYVIGEGIGGLPRRLAAKQAQIGQPIPRDRLVFSRSAVRFLDANQIAALTDDIDILADRRGEPPIAIYVDTLARNLGADENSSQDVSAFVESADALKTRYGATVTVIHHPGHADAKRARGAYVLPAAADFIYLAEKAGDGVVRVRCDKAKDHEPPEPVHYRLTGVPLRIGDQECSGVAAAECEPADEPRTSGLGGTQAAMLDVLRTEFQQRRQNLIDSGYNPDGARVTAQEWRDAGMRSHAIGPDRRAFHKVKASLHGRGAIEITGTFVAPRDEENVS